MFARRLASAEAEQEPTLAEQRLASIDQATVEQRLHSYIILTYPKDVHLAAIAASLRKNPHVLSVEENSRFTMSATYPNDTYFLQRPGFPYKGEYQWGMAAMNFPSAWDKVKGNAYVGILDTGVDGQQNGAHDFLVSHQDLKQNLRVQFSWNSTTSSTGYFFPFDIRPPNLDGSHYHGTHVAGVIGARPNDTYGVSGGCWNCSLMMVSQSGPTDQVTDAIYVAARAGAQVINYSGTKYDDFTGNPISCPSSNSQFNALCDALTFADQRGVVVVASSGNRLARVGFPASESTSPTKTGIIAVGGMNEVNQFWNNGYVPALSGRTSCNPNIVGTGDDQSGSNCGAAQTVVAPAKDILSTFWQGFPNVFWCGDQRDPENPSINPPTNPPNPNAYAFQPGWGNCTGTSMAAPHVTAVAALARSANPLLTNTQIKEIIKRQTLNPQSLPRQGDFRIDHNWGWGVPDANAVVLTSLSLSHNETNFGTYNSAISNRVTPLFGFYSALGADHFYTIVPQMATAALSGKLRPRPLGVLTQSGNVVTSVTATCPNPSGGQCPPVVFPPFPPTYQVSAFSPALVAKKPDLSDIIPSTYVRLDYVSGANPVASPIRRQTNSQGIISDGVLFDGTGGTQITLKTSLDLAEFDLPYVPIGNTVSTSVLPSFPNTATSPRAVAYVYTTHVNPLGGPDLVPLNRYSWRCADDLTWPSCAPTRFPYHVSHVYATVYGNQLILNQGYRLDGIEGYIFSPQYAQPPLTSPLCRKHKYDPQANVYDDDGILFVGATTACNETSDGFSVNGGAQLTGYNQALNGGTVLLGFVPIPPGQTVSGPFAAAGRTAVSSMAGVVSPATVTVNGSSNRSVQVGSSINPSLSVIVKDAANNPVPNVTVSFVAPSIGASANFASGIDFPWIGYATTNSSGIADISPIANSVLGLYNISASVPGATVATFVITNIAGPPASFTIVGGGVQSATVNSVFAQPLEVLVKDSVNNPVAAATVLFNAPSSGASALLSGASAITNASGKASVMATANGAVGGPYYVAASVSGYPALGTLQFALSNLALPTFLNNGFEAPVVSGATYTTNYPITNWTCAGVCGLQNNAWQTSPEGTQTAYVGGFSDVYFPAGSIWQSLSLGAGTYKLRFKAARRPGDAGPQPIRVKVNGVQIGSLISPVNSTFGQYETSSFTVGAGSHQIAMEATHTSDWNMRSSLIDVVTVALTAANRCIATSGGNNQSTLGNTAFPVALQVTVTNCSGGPISGATVSFNIPGIAANPVYPAATASLSAYSATTNASGIASVTATANNMAGTFNVNASVDDASVPAAFTLTNTKAAPSIVNASFETPSSPGGTMWQPTGAGWTFGGFYTGVTDTTVNPNPTSYGTQAGILMHDTNGPNGVAAVISQTINFTVGGTYSLSFRTALNDGWNQGDQYVQAYLNGGLIGPTCSPDTTWSICGPTSFTVPAGNHSISFKTTRNQYYNYAPILIDQVTIQ